MQTMRRALFAFAGSGAQCDRSMNDDYLSIRDVCDVLRMSRSRVYGLQAERAQNGFPAPIKLNPAKCGRVLFRRADVVAWIESHAKREIQCS